jgi:hypothetical protein
MVTSRPAPSLQEGDAAEVVESAAHPGAHLARRFGFVMELQAGLQTVYANWRSVVDADPNIDATWVPITYHERGGLIERTPFVPRQLRAAARSFLQVKRGPDG